ncbi:efflux transporter periplasmic adaptor subunit [Mucilaginibacter sp. PPCGB 2223]|uniref:efflux RND transporter periplasmic adaptor subunit n=1 Tax=Mucilaginibacter sp. PPCGB 2223 TaxID=1886027 RepID=UPI000825A98D|nr:efflux RND transporter periplasmic adaptor subunit [Mucilaginibacter sp. PPCGB 2223]OCX50833.1 efflux transporter periplasmic adaptor subunit [Mucilaginibacter sp. PPCGB 2223]
MKIKYIVWPLVILLIAYLVYNKFYGEKAKELQAQTGGAGGKKGGKRSGIVPVNVMIVKDTAFSSAIDITGSISANEQVDLRSETAGNITGIFFNEGSHVEKGQVLVKVYDKDLVAQLKQVQVQIKLAEQTEYRNRVLLSKEAISKEEYDTSLTSLNSYQAQADAVKAQIDKTVVRAPFSGTIGLRNISPGGYLSPQGSIATLVNIDPAKITFSVPERYLPLVHAGSKINFTIESSRKPFTGTVYAIEPNIDVTSRTITLRAKADNKEGLLKAGGFAKIHFALDQIPKTIMVPTEAVIPDIKGSNVFLVKNGHAVQKAVKTDTRTESKIQVVDGLKAGDSLIVSGIIQMRPKVAVKVIKVIK